MNASLRQLFLLRHAKSSWDDPEVEDRDRPLAPRGRRAAKAMADHVRREGVGPALVLCSPARRARETAERIVPALVDDPPVEFDDELYDTSAQCLLERLRAIDDAAPSVMLIGHNPSLEALAVDLAGRGAKLDELRRKYPTAALATLEFAGSWRDLGPAKAELTDFVTPKKVAKG